MYYPDRIVSASLGTHTNKVSRDAYVCKLSHGNSNVYFSLFFGVFYKYNNSI